MKAHLAFIAAALLVLCVAVFSPVAAVTDDNGAPVISVSGNGKVTTAPDRAIVSLAVETENGDVKKAQQENAARMDRCINALKEMGLTSDDLKTTGYNIHTEMDRDNSGSILPGKVKYYKVTNTLEVTLSDINRTGEVIDTAIANGANSVNYISFTLSDEKAQELRSQALTAAVTQARGDADTVVNALNMKILGVQDVSVGGSYSPMRYTDNFMLKGAEAAISTPIEPDTVDVTASVSISYLIA